MRKLIEIIFFGTFSNKMIALAVHCTSGHDFIHIQSQTFKLEFSSYFIILPLSLSLLFKVGSKVCALVKGIFITSAKKQN